MRGIDTLYVNRDELRTVSETALSTGLDIEEFQAAKIIDQYEYAELSGKRTHGFVQVYRGY